MGRLPGKVMKVLSNKMVIEHVIERLHRCQNVNNIIITTTTNSEDDEIAKFCSNNNILFYRGSENNVLERYYQTALISSSDIIIRMTCDCPLIDPTIIDKMLANFIELNIDYYQPEYYNGNYAFPDGFDCEIFTFEILKQAFLNATLPEEKEHVTPYIRKYYNYNTKKYKKKKKKKKKKVLALIPLL